MRHHAIAKAAAPVVIAVSTFLAANACAQENSGTQMHQAKTNIPSPSSIGAASQPGQVQIFVDLSESFVDYLISGNYLQRAIKRAGDEMAQQHLTPGTWVRISVIGHSHNDVTSGGAKGSFEHLQAREWRVGGKYTREKVIGGVRAWLHDIESSLRAGKLQREGNTAVVMAFDRAAEVGRKAGATGECRWIAITDLEDTEMGMPLPKPYKENQMQGCTVTAIGAGVTLREGTKAERKLRAAWEQWFSVAGASDLFWISNP